jgi:hypothetical protein
MAILTQNKIKAGHWYTADGKPMHRMPTARGDGDRSTTIKDARRLGLYPSVTSILGIFAKPALDDWKMNQVALATLKCQKQETEDPTYWCKRVKDVAFEQVEQAADLGSSVHEALELGMNGEPFNPEFEVHVRPVLTWKEQTGIVICEREITLVNKEHGFAGTADVFFRYGQNGIGILDYKTRKTKPGEEVQAYDGQAMQLAAYAATYWGEEALDRVLAANVYISTTEPGRMAVVKHADLRKHWEAYKLSAALWRYLKDFDPRLVGTVK